MTLPPVDPTVLQALDAALESLDFSQIGSYQPVIIPVNPGRKSKMAGSALRFEAPADREFSGECPGGRYRFVDDLDEAITLLDYWSWTGCWAAIDIETGVAWRYGEDGERLWLKGSEPWTSPIYLCSVSVEPGEAVVFDMRELMQHPRFFPIFRVFLTSCRLVAHNALFEMSFFLRYFGVLGNVAADTFVMHQIATAGIKKGNGLDDLTLKYFGEEAKVDKSWQSYFLKIHPQSPIPNAAVRYSAGDVTRLLEIARRVEGELVEHDLWKVWSELEWPFLPEVVRAKVHGLPLDLELLQNLRQDYEARQEKTRQRFTELVGEDVNIASQPQVLRWFNTQGVRITSTDEDALSPVAAEKQGTLEGEVAAVVLEDRNASKFLSTYVMNLLINHRNPITGRVHPDFKQASTVTGRMACVRRGTNIEVVRDVSRYPQGIPVEEVSVGDLVYTFDDDRNLTLRKVTWAGKTGRRALVRVHWKSTGSQKRGYVDLTADHRVRLISGEYKAAQNLCSGDRVMALSRGLADGYARLWATGHPEITREHRFIYECVHGIEPDNIHHKNTNTLDNRVENLESMSNSDHTRLHGSEVPDELRAKRSQIAREQWANNPRLQQRRPRGPNHPGYLNLSKEWLEEVLSQNAGQITVFQRRYGLDFATVRNYLEKYGIDHKAIARRFNGRGEEITPEKVVEWRKISEERGPTAGRQAAALGYYRWREEQEALGFVPYNHQILSVEILDEEDDVYDLAVEETHNFIAGGICVHNCENPSSQNMPKDEDQGRIRKAIVALPGFLLITADFSQFEVRGLAEMANEVKMISVFIEGDQAAQALKAFCRARKIAADVSALQGSKKAEEREQFQLLCQQHSGLEPLATHVAECDFHKRTASVLFGVPTTAVTKEQRSRAKTITFAVPYGASEMGIAEQAGITIEEARELLESYYSTYRATKRFLDLCRQQATHGFTQTPAGRKRFYPKKSRQQIYEELVAAKKLYDTLLATATEKIRAEIAAGIPSREEDGETRYQVRKQWVTRSEWLHSLLKTSHWAKTVAKWRKTDPSELSGKIHKWRNGKIEREGTNHPVQALNADATKLASILIGARLRALDPRCCILLWIHDEIVVSVPAEIADEAAQIVEGSMIEAAKRWLIRTPVEVALVTAPCWQK